MASGNEFQVLAASGVAILGLSAVTMTTLAVVQGFKDTGKVDNTTADNFITAIALFGTFASVIILALVGKVIVGMFKSGY